jgi:3'-phosphoadenosine 5'-phosphosulfate sulfotransferase (PAPS reductase)/FAD synthetase
MRREEVLILKKDAPVARCTFPDNLQLNVEEGWISKSYGVKESSVILHFTWNAIARVPAVFTFTAA